MRFYFLYVIQTIRNYTTKKTTAAPLLTERRPGPAHAIYVVVIGMQMHVDVRLDQESLHYVCALQKASGDNLVHPEVLQCWDAVLCSLYLYWG